MCDDDCNSGKSGTLKVSVYNGFGIDGVFHFIPICNGNWGITDSDGNSQISMATDDKTATLLTLGVTKQQFIQSLLVWFEAPSSYPAVFPLFITKGLVTDKVAMDEINLDFNGNGYNFLFILALISGTTNSTPSVTVTTDINMPGAFCCYKTGNYYTTRDVCDLDISSMIASVKNNTGINNVIPVLIAYNFGTNENYRYNIPAQLNTLPGLPPNTGPVTNDLLKYIQF